jgi:cytochrome c-type biogenesis protein CcmH
MAIAPRTALSSRPVADVLRLGILAAVLAFVPAMLLRADTRPTLDDVSDGLTCQCGCGLTVANCNHPQCEFSVPVRTQIEAMISRDMSRGEILASFRAKYGEKILSAPTLTGFNLAAWVTPFAAVLAGGGLIMWLFGRWRSERPPSSPRDAAASDSALRERLESEIKDDF